MIREKISFYLNIQNSANLMTDVTRNWYIDKRQFHLIMPKLILTKINQTDRRDDSIYFKNDRPNLALLNEFLLKKCKINKPFTVNAKKKTIKLRKNLNKNDLTLVSYPFYFSCIN